MSAQGWIQRKILVNNKNQSDWFSVIILTYILFLQVGKCDFITCVWHIANIIQHTCPLTRSVNIVFTLPHPGGRGVFHWTSAKKQGKHGDSLHGCHHNIWSTYAQLISVLFMSPASYLLYSPFVPKKDVFVPWGMTISMSRDELLIERRGKRDSWHAAGYTERVRHSSMFVTCSKGIFNSV